MTLGRSANPQQLLVWDENEYHEGLWGDPGVAVSPQTPKWETQVPTHLQEGGLPYSSRVEYMNTEQVKAHHCTVIHSRSWGLPPGKRIFKVV